MSHKDKIDPRRFIVLRPYTDCHFGSNFHNALDEATRRAMDTGESYVVFEVTLRPHSRVDVTREVKVSEADG
jgi:hypothetical protein